ncbi:NupC/NupG family nucleoside CNT transporter [Aequorivita vladivostokensis]|uniref:Na+ dependent nucleoside transporter n=1 Tax=Aequorivita vladivostokensis TaxID=171194 RepID=A0ABR5DGB8_9FLAO|nr:nucleoside transporter C-terminal domain-containing protein [Aequorivita vladivostokensis]KJJ37805.1 Na+ dependent nucleoside transporter [Aequorivita vladivostokensis]MBF31232.1 Na+ dependent nucleoside transporter [Aequorivita sp.]HAV54993.1 Na+ dependent nucleoside transporter [Aequorivita sp.]HBL78594.1 Na+ dependent nucleoside transporter [Aequorivita sp.]|tara:strand:- start:71550 stop:73259 length:1710 start_codon:yes stop_codon:yes gene_type:complete
MQKFTLVAIVLFFFGNTFAQSIEKTWQFSEVKDENGLSLLNINPEKDFLKLDNGLFEYQVASDSLVSKGDYMFQNNLLVLFFNKPADSIRRFRVEQVTDSSLTLSENNYKYQLKTPGLQNVSALETVAKTSEIIPSQGFSFQSLWRGVLGMVSLLIIAFLFSSNRRAINWKTVGIGLAFQLLIAIGVLKVDFIKSGFEGVGQLFVNVLDYTKAGSEFLFGGMLDINSFGFIFAFQVLPTIIFFSALTSVLFYFGIIQVVVKGMGWLLTKLLNISGAESLSVAGNIFLGQTEAPLLIKAYLEKMNKSEMLLVMIGGMATVAGAVLAAYIGFLGGDDPELRLTFAKHLLAASVMAAPGAIVISKILYPQTEPINTDVKVSSEKIGSNFLDAIANGTTEGLRLAVNVGAMLLVFVAFIAMLNGILGWVGEVTSVNEWVAANSAYQSLSLEAILGTIFAPLMWLIGVAKEDMLMMGQLLGIKLAASEFVGYIQLAELKNVTNELHLNYEKSIIMATYMLCGFANFASIGIQIGGIGSLAPGQRKTLSKFGMKALIGGTIASLISATIAGMIIG